MFCLSRLHVHARPRAFSVTNLLCRTYVDPAETGEYEYDRESEPAYLASFEVQGLG